MDGPDLTVKHFSGLTLPNPFVIGSGILDPIPLYSVRHSVVCLQVLSLKQKASRCVRIIAGPPGTNYAVMKKAFDEGWGAVIAKTVSLDCSKVRTSPSMYVRGCLMSALGL